MKIPLIFILTLYFLTLLAAPSSAHFFPNITSIPPSLIPKNTSWDAFLKLNGCHRGEQRNGLAKIKKYFQYFGYINSSSSNFTDNFDDYLESAIKTYQKNFNLNQTGELDAPTLAHIIQPRCGNPDIVNGTTTMNSGKSNSTVARYSFFPGAPRWPENQAVLTYAFLSENELDNATRRVFARAFDRWSIVTPLNFSEISNYSAADIKIGFFNGDHSDGEPFDGVMGTLAHAFSPPAGFFHLDSEENWVLDGNFFNSSSFLTAVDLESVAVHEIGHILGLGHSSVEDAIMYPSLTASTRRVDLADDDIVGIQELYGSNPNNNGTMPTTRPRRERDTTGGAQGNMKPLGIYRMFWAVGLLLVLLVNIL